MGARVGAAKGTTKDKIPTRLTDELPWRLQQLWHTKNVMDEFVPFENVEIRRTFLL